LKRLILCFTHLQVYSQSKTHLDNDSIPLLVLLGVLQDSMHEYHLCPMKMTYIFSA